MGLAIAALVLLTSCTQSQTVTFTDAGGRKFHFSMSYQRKPGCSAGTKGISPIVAESKHSLELQSGAKGGRWSVLTGNMVLLCDADWSAPLDREHGRFGAHESCRPIRCKDASSCPHVGFAPLCSDAGWCTTKHTGGSLTSLVEDVAVALADVRPGEEDEDARQRLRAIAARHAKGATLPELFTY